MTTDITDIEIVRKIKRLETSIKRKRQILTIKETYINNLSAFQIYDTVRVECHRVNDDVSRLMFSIGMEEQTLERLRKEV